MTRVFRVYYGEDKTFFVDVQTDDIIMACQISQEFLEKRNYTYKLYDISKVEQVAEPIDFTPTNIIKCENRS